MKQYLPVLVQCPLFAGSTPEEIAAMLACLNAQVRAYGKRETIYPSGTEAFALGVVMNGSVDVIQEDFWGNQSLLARLAPGEIFAESFVLSQTASLPVSVTADQPATVLLLDYHRIMGNCGNTCAYHERLIKSLLTILARKNVHFTQKIGIITKKTIREKVLAFLSAETRRAGSSRFTVPYDRQAMADYLSVDRSALSRTLSELQTEGLLTYSKNVFELKKGSYCALPETVDREKGVKARERVRERGI